MRPLLVEIQRQLDGLQRERDKRSHFIQHRGRQELAWVVFEREQLFRFVNRLRGERGKGPLPYEEIERIERAAVGHSDYSVKLALGAEVLVLMGEAGE